MHSFEIPEGLKQDLDFSCAGESRFPAFLAALQVLLFRYTSQREVVVASRTVPGSPSIKLVQCVARLESSLTFKSLLDLAREPEIDSSRHGKILLEAFDTKDPGGTPLYQVILNVWGESILTPQVVQPKDLVSSEPVLVIDLEERGEKLLGNIGCSIELFDASLLSRFVAHFINLLRSGLNDPERSLSRLTLTSPKENEKLVNAWNDTEAEIPGDGIIHHWIEVIARESPQAPAVQLADQTLTYAELNSRANQLANYLRTVDVGPDCYVGILMSRSFDSVVCILAILKAGGAYVPLDPSYPDERLQAIWREIDSPILLTQSDLKNRIDAGEVRSLCLDTNWNEIEELSVEPPAVEITRDDLAYVIFTSGSTGKPKGILLTHGGLSNLTHASNSFFGVHKKSRILQFSSFGFDVAVWEIFMALAAGATLCLGVDRSLFSLLTLTKTMREEHITMALLPPSLLNAIPEEGLDSLETVIAVGERCTNANVKKWAPGRKFFNGYGPAEGTVTASAYLTNADEPIRSLGPSIGRPLENIEMYILDSALNPAPVGVPGEMCLGGICLARGYLNQEEKTTEQFVEHPFRPGRRIYRTGDRARFLPDGNIEFLGRMDDQVKIRGYRVEPGEIEAVLNGCIGVTACTVSVKSAANNQPYLVGYIVEDIDAPPRMDDILRSLRQKLPAYMVPSALVVLNKMPLTTNGKVDRFELPLPVPSDFQHVSGEAESHWMNKFLGL